MPSTSQLSPPRPNFNYTKLVIKIGIGLVVLIMVIFFAFQISPWPSTMLIRYAFDKEGAKVNEALEKLVPADVTTLKNEQYIPGDKDAMLDVYLPTGVEGSDKKLPVIVWIHGGGLISGSKEHVANYCKILSSKSGCVVAAIDYSVAPEHTYPLPVRQANAALQYIMKNAGRLHADTAKLFLAGDSGGSLIAAQVACIISSEDYSKLVKIPTDIKLSQLKGMILYGGIYSAGELDLKGEFGGFLRSVLWSYSGNKDFVNDEYFKTVSVIDHITNKFPPSFISAGNMDPLLSQSKTFANKLAELNVRTDTLFYPEDYKPILPHEYQFNLETVAGKDALEKSIEFLSQF
ncbi:MAG: alpha/beta hydrolase [bacterium]